MTPDTHEVLGLMLKRELTFELRSIGEHFCVAVQMLPPGSMDEQPLYEVVWLNTNPASVLLLSTVWECEVIAQLTISEAESVFRRAIDCGIEVFVEQKISRLKRCPTRLSEGSCHHCSALLEQSKELLQWIRDLIAFYQGRFSSVLVPKTTRSLN